MMEFFRPQEKLFLSIAGVGANGGSFVLQIMKMFRHRLIIGIVYGKINKIQGNSHS